MCHNLMSNCHLNVIYTTINNTYYTIVIDETTKCISQTCHVLWPFVCEKNNILLQSSFVTFAGTIMEKGLHEVFKVFVLERTTKQRQRRCMGSALLLFALSMSSVWKFFFMETLCSHVLIYYDLLASTTYSKKEFQSFSFFVLVKLFEYFSLSNL